MTVKGAIPIIKLSSNKVKSYDDLKDNAYDAV